MSDDTHQRVLGNGVAALVFAVLTFSNLKTGGYTQPTHFLIGLSPLLAMMLAGLPSGVFWLLAGLCEILVLYHLHAIGYAFPVDVGQGGALLPQVVGGLVLQFRRRGAAATLCCLIVNAHRWSPGIGRACHDIFAAR